MLNFFLRLWSILMAEWHRIPPLRLPEEALTLAPGDALPTYQPLERVVLSDEVSRTLFVEYAEHRRGQRGEEETGWVLMGRREEKEAVVLATLPAGALREAGIAHVRFNADAQALASRLVRQADRRLTILGVVHTHPGALRHPSKGDFQGDKQWVRLLRGQEGVFGIGTADGDEEPPEATDIAWQPEAHMQIYEGLRFTWYALGVKDRNYRPLPVALTLGPDLAYALHAVWPALEAHGARLEKLWKQLAHLRFEIQQGDKEPVLTLRIRLEGPEELRVMLHPQQVSYGVWRDGQILMVDLHEPAVDRGVYLLLAELAQDKVR